MSRYAGMGAHECVKTLRRRQTNIKLQSLTVALLFVANFFLGWVKIPLWAVLAIIVACVVVAIVRCALAKRELMKAEDRACRSRDLSRVLEER